jgi:hypothetical protein
MSTEESGLEGTYLARARAPDCGNCGREMAKAHRIHLGAGYCAICYPRIFPPRACHVCGKTARAHRNDPNPTCGACLREDRSCLRCGKLTPKASLRVGKQVACAACAHYYRIPESCDVCTKPSTRLSRSRAFPENGRMCVKCLRDTVGATCSHCGKHRTVKFMTLGKKPLCKDCCASPNASHLCPDCSSVVNGSGDRPCLLCAIKRANVSRQLSAQHLLVTPQVRQLYGEFTHWGNDIGRANRLAAGAARYLQFLAKLDVAMQKQATALSQEMIIQVFATEELRQMGLLSKYLAETGLLKDNSLARRRHSDVRLLASKLEAVVNQPWAVDITKFREELSAREVPLAMRTHKAYLHAAISLLTYAQVSRASQITQKAVNGLLAKKPGLRASLTAFLVHLDTVHGNRLSPKGKPSKAAPVVRQAKYVRLMLDAVDAAPERPARLAITAALLSKLLNVPIEQVLQLRHSDLDLEKFTHLRIDGKWLNLPDRLHPILESLPSDQWRKGLDADPLLFEGRLFMDGLSTTTVRYHVKQALNRLQKE